MKYVNNFSDLLSNSDGNCNDMSVFNIKLKFYDTYDVPTYILPYLINGDTNGLRKSEIAEVDNWLKDMEGEVIVDCSGGDSHFSSDPLFGEPCECETCDIYVHVPDDTEVDDTYTPNRVRDEESGGWKWDERRGDWADGNATDDDDDF